MMHVSFDLAHRLRLQRIGIPDFQCLVVTAADNSCPIGMEGDAGDRFRVSIERLQYLAGAGIPDLTCVVPATADNSPSIRTEVQAGDIMSVACERMQYPA